MVLLMKRVFMAIKISLENRKKAEEWRAGFNGLPVRWIANENLHLTLIPPSEEVDINSPISRIEKIQGKITPFTIKFHKITYAPNPHRPRLIWAEGEAVKSLLELQKEIAGLLGAKKLTHEFKPHLTLARFRPEDFYKFSVKELNERISWIEKVNSVYLLESILEPKGARYEVLKNFKL